MSRDLDALCRDASIIHLSRQGTRFQSTSPPMPETLNIAVCISNEVTLSDFITPMEILSSINVADHPILGPAMGDVPYRIKIDYLAPTMEPVVSTQGLNSPTLNPTLTYGEALATGRQFDILWVPAGPMGDYAPGLGQGCIPKEEIAFIAQQARKAKYVMSVCAGAVQLALAGVLAGKRATTNKAFYRAIVAATPKDIEWVPQARWIVDGNVWTSSGVAAGSDMALAFAEHLGGAKVARHIRGIIEIPEVTDKDDPFAALHGLV
ncbi:class I glutamine amidotransferase-like protein [Mycena maculata]|uniref:Class I glutamine amidotransferase-like protein n=1 Tax=Mycena maculata TaxID=230809 RepID=A0AAD7J3F4_9AGAR|nr:class I glutamine amidotransferase-like protein [Mycena maculata]